ncbi:MAG TPA: carboxymuconolactone decarboxylase family protein [Candidatus Nanopelagicaceae bacterium]|nr:carboxymuconolactone decarboxylase family protein [Candidatus Nanopelagicaceae bacterium]
MSKIDYQEVLTDLGQPVAELRRAIPEVWSAYAAMHRAALAEGELPAKYKELIALAISIVKRCDGCIAAHARGAARRGATAQEVAEMIGLTVLLDGGPATVYGPRAWQAYQQFAEKGTPPAAGS